MKLNKKVTKNSKLKSLAIVFHSLPYPKEQGGKEPYLRVSNPLNSSSRVLVFGNAEVSISAGSELVAQAVMGILQDANKTPLLCELL